MVGREKAQVTEVAFLDLLEPSMTSTIMLNSKKLQWVAISVSILTIFLIIFVSLLSRKFWRERKKKQQVKTDSSHFHLKRRFFQLKKYFFFSWIFIEFNKQIKIISNWWKLFVFCPCQGDCKCCQTNLLDEKSDHRTTDQQRIQLERHRRANHPDRKTNVDSQSISTEFRKHDSD